MGYIILSHSIGVIFLYTLNKTILFKIKICETLQYINTLHKSYQLFYLLTNDYGEEAMLNITITVLKKKKKQLTDATYNIVFDKNYLKTIYF